MTSTGSVRRNPWTWIPTLYFAEGLPYATAMTVSVIMYKNLGISNTDIALYTSSLYLPWVLKPLWSPVVELLDTRRRWIWLMQLVAGASLAGVVVAIPAVSFFRWTIAFFWLLAFCSATHDIAADGFYMLANNEKEQAMLVGVRNMFYRLATFTCQSPVVIFAGMIYRITNSFQSAWSAAVGLLGLLMLCFGTYHERILPRPLADRHGNTSNPFQLLEQFLLTFRDFFRKPRIVILILFLLLYRFGEAQLVKMVAPFLLDLRHNGGLGLSTEQVGLFYGTIGVLSLLAGGVLGGIAASMQGLSRWLWPMVLAIHLPDAIFVYLAYVQPASSITIAVCLAIEQFGYGFGFTGYMLYMLHIARGKHQTAHYAICTGFMALGMMIPGMWSGWLQEHLGYPHFFLWVLLATLPSYLVVFFIPLEAGFGKRYDLPETSEQANAPRT